jgi:D-alanyl-D-alanine dipeptidase
MAAAAAAGGALTAAVPAVAVTHAPESAVVRPVSAVPEAEVRTVASIVPIGPVHEPEPLEMKVADLVKAAGLAEQHAAAFCDADLDDLGRVKPWVRQAARFLSCLYDQPDLIGVAQRSRDSDHSRGLAIDLMIRGDRGDRIAECALANQDELGIDYVIWEQRINHGDGWDRMSDRGSDTENHYDHVHISFERNAPEDIPFPQRCD